MKRILRDNSNNEKAKKVYEPAQSKQQPITGSTNSLELFTADDIMSLMSSVDELKDLLIQAVNCGDGLWEFMVGDNTYQLSTSPLML